jgi:hypothetical protein
MLLQLIFVGYTDLACSVLGKLPQLSADGITGLFLNWIFFEVGIIFRNLNI